MCWFAILGFVLNQGCFLIGLHYTSATNGSVLNTLIPLFTLLFVIMRGIETATIKRMMGFAAALAGVLIMLKVEQFSMSESTVLGDFLILINAISYAAYLAFSKRFIEQHDRIWITAYLFIFGTIGLTAAAIPDYMTYQWPAITSEVFWSAVYAIIGGTILTYFLTTWVLAYTSSSEVGLFIYIQPVVTSILALIAWGEFPTMRTYIGTAFIFAGLYFTLGKPQILPKKDKIASPPSKTASAG